MSRHDHKPRAGSDPCGQSQPGQPMLTLEEARARMVAAMRPVDGEESLGLAQALGRLLAAPVRSPRDVPPFRSSSMDGFALAGSVLPASGTTSLDVAGMSRAGHPWAGTVATGQCVQIMTGAPLPDGADTVVMQEQVKIDQRRVVIGTGHRAGQWVRPVGEDVRRGDVVLGAGSTLHPARLGLIASMGIDSVTVRRRPRIAILSTGDELQAIGATLGPAQVYDSNRYSLAAMLARLPVEIVDLGMVADSPDDTERALRCAAAQVDAIVTSGGVSVGEADHVIEALRRHGEFAFWKVAMKPGRPIAFGRFGAAWFFGLPGNPVSAIVTFCQLVRPALQALAGCAEAEPDIVLRASCESRLRKQPGRLEFQRGVLRSGAEGGYTVRAVNNQGSGVLRSLSEANCFIVLPLESGDVDPGSEVDVQPFATLGLL